MADKTPPSITTFCDTILPLMQASADGQRIMEDVEVVVATDRWNSFDRFHETTQTLVDRYEAAGAKTEVYPVLSGGSIDTGRWIIQEVSDVHGATVDIISPVKKRLLDYKENPWHVIQWSSGTSKEGITCELVIIDSLEELEATPRGSLTGKIILMNMAPRGMLKKIDATGAIGVITDLLQPELEDATAWVKFGWGQIPRSEDPARLVGLVLSHSEGQRLRGLIRGQGALTVHVTVDVRKYVGHHDVVSGLVPGSDDPQDEVWVLAHSAEPGAMDNASGVSICLEMARILEGLIADGKIKRPRRTIRFLNAYECYGFFHYMEHVKRLQMPLAGVCLDTLGAKPSVCDGRLTWRSTIPMSAGFVDRIGEYMLQATLALENPGYTLQTGPFVSTSDTLVGDPKYGFPCPWLSTHYRDEGVFDAYHSSGDTADEILSPEGLAACAVSMAGYLYYLADAGNEELMELATMETDRMVAILSGGVKNKMAGLAPTIGQTVRHGTDDQDASETPLSSNETGYLIDAHQTSIDQLKRWMWGGDRQEIMTHLDACETRVKTAAAGTYSKQDPPVSSRARRVPYRIAFLSPSLANTPEDIARRIGAARLSDWAVFWADGRRNIKEITTALSCEYQHPVSLANVALYFEALADLGYVKLIEQDQMISKDRLIQDLRTLGLASDMDVMVHSSLTSIGDVAGGAATMIDALLEAIGPGGTLLMPSFNHRAAQVFNPMTTPTTNGTIPDVMWRRSDAVRSLHPTHCVAAIGPNAAHYCRDDHVDVGIWAPESPIGRLVQGDGYLLALGVTHFTTTAFHVAEMSIPCGCIDPFGNTDRIVTSDGPVKEVRGLAFRNGPCPVHPEKLHTALRDRGQERFGKVGQADCSLVGAHDFWTARREHLKDACPACTVQPTYI